METAKLVRFLRDCAAAYYNTGETLISDAEYDKLIEELKTKDPNNEFLKKVGAPPQGTTYNHDSPVGSQEKLKDKSEFDRWCKQVIELTKPGIVPFAFQWKLDGLTVVAYYRDGKLIRVLSRGDGECGEDLTKNALKLQGIKKEIPGFTGSLRGEAILPIDTFKKFIQPFGYKNPRNAISGLLRDLKENDLLKHGRAIFYDIFPNNYSSEEERINFLLDNELPTVSTNFLSSIDDMWASYKQLEEDRKGLNYEIDGCIIRANDVQVQANLGMSSDFRPKWSRCVKFEAQIAVTRLVDITLTMGHTGAIIPTALLEPVEIGGVTVSHVLLNNYDYIENLGLTIGCQVEIERAGEVIPYLRRAINKTDKPISAPTICFTCASPLKKEGVHLICTNKMCPGKEFQKLRNWVNKRGIKYLGDEILQEIYNERNIKKPADLYTLSEQNLYTVKCGNGVVGDRAKQIIEEIQKSRKCSLFDFLGSFGIPMLGRRQVEILSEQGIDTLDKFLNLTVEQLRALSGFSEEGSKAPIIVNGIQEFKPLIIETLKHMTMEEKKMEINGSGKFADRIICFTGVRPTAEEQAKFQNLGGMVKDGVSKNLTHLIVKDPNSDSNKSKKARSLGIAIIGYKEFQQWLV